MFFNVEGQNKKDKLKEFYDVIIIGGGPAGISAAIYAIQGGACALVIEKAIEGGQMNLTDIVENYPGFKSIKGQELSSLMKQHAEHFGAEFYSGEVKEIKSEEDFKEVIIDNGRIFKSKTLMIASGSNPKKLGVKGEKEFTSKGVSYCASCDGHFFKDKKVAVIGGGNTAVEEAVYLSNIAREVYIIHRRDQLRADKLYQERAFEKENIKFIWNSVVEEIKGKEQVQSLVLKNVKTDELKEELFDGVFIFVGLVPETSFLDINNFEIDEYGFLITDKNMETKVKGIYAIGDIRHKEIRQIVTAVADGAIASSHAVREYINETRNKQGKIDKIEI